MEPLPPIQFWRANAFAFPNLEDCQAKRLKIKHDYSDEEVTPRTLTQLPNELLKLIVSHLDRRSICKLARTWRCLNPICRDALYTNLVVRDYEICGLAPTLIANPHLSSYVCYLEVMPANAADPVNTRLFPLSRVYRNCPGRSLSQTAESMMLYQNFYDRLRLSQINWPILEPSVEEEYLYMETALSGGMSFLERMEMIVLAAVYRSHGCGMRHFDWPASEEYRHHYDDGDGFHNYDIELCLLLRALPNLRSLTIQRHYNNRRRTLIQSYSERKPRCTMTILERLLAGRQLDNTGKYRTTDLPALRHLCIKSDAPELVSSVRFSDILSCKDLESISLEGFALGRQTMNCFVTQGRKSSLPIVNAKSLSLHGCLLSERELAALFACMPKLGSFEWTSRPLAMTKGSMLRKANPGVYLPASRIVKVLRASGIKFKKLSLRFFEPAAEWRTGRRRCKALFGKQTPLDRALVIMNEAIDLRSFSELRELEITALSMTGLMVYDNAKAYRLLASSLPRSLRCLRLYYDELFLDREKGLFAIPLDASLRSYASIQKMHEDAEWLSIWWKHVPEMLEQIPQKFVSLEEIDIFIPAGWLRLYTRANGVASQAIRSVPIECPAGVRVRIYGYDRPNDNLKGKPTHVFQWAIKDRRGHRADDDGTLEFSEMR